MENKMEEDTITLEQAQRWYVVPWVMDEDDLKVIKRTRKQYGAGHQKISIYIEKALWATAQRN